MTSRPWVPPAAAALCVSLGRYAFGRSPVLLPLTAGFVLAAVLIAITPLAAGWREGGGNRRSISIADRYVPVFGGVVFGLLSLSAVRLGIASEETVWFGLPEERIVKIEAHAREDGFESSRGNVLVPVRLNRCRGPDGSEADAGGRILVILDNADRLPPRGSEMRILVSEIFTEGENIVSGSAADSIGTEWRRPVSRFRYRIYSGIEAKIDRLESGTASLLKALLLGTREDLTLREMELFRRAGCMHVLALSGMHLSIITGMALGVLGIFGRRNLAAAGAACVVIGYVFLAGGRPSLLRAATMVLVGTAALLRGRRPEGRLILVSSFLIVSLASPQSMESLSFTLSFAAVAGIVFTADRFHGFLKRYIPPYLSGALSVSLASQLFTAPILIARFGILYPGGLAAAIPVGLLAGLYLGMGLIYVIIPGFTGIYLWRGAFDIVRRGMIECTRLASGIPGIRCSPFPGILIWGCTAAAVLALLYAGDIRIRTERIITWRRNRGTATVNRSKRPSRTGG